MTRGDVDLGNWRQAPHNRWSFNHVREIIPTARLEGGGPGGARLPRHNVDLGDVLIAAKGTPAAPFRASLGTSFTDALMVLHRGSVVYEWYQNAAAAHQPHILMSISKSLTGALAGCLAADGLLDLEAPVATYVPEVAASPGYGDATIRHVLDMTVNLDFEENYLDADGAYARYRMAHGWNPASGQSDLHAFLLGLGRRSGPHGRRFAYQSPNSDLLGWIVERAGKLPFSRLFSERIWKPLGACDGDVTVDRLGAPRTAGGICVTIADMALFGEMMRNRGAVDGVQIVPGDFVDDIRSGGSRAAWLDGDMVELLPAGQYRSQWYQVGNSGGAFCGIGIHGQWLYIDPAAAMVVAKQSSQPLPADDALDQLNLATFAALAKALS